MNTRAKHSMKNQHLAVIFLTFITVLLLSTNIFAPLNIASPLSCNDGTRIMSSDLPKTYSPVFQGTATSIGLTKNFTKLGGSTFNVTLTNSFNSVTRSKLLDISSLGISGYSINRVDINATNNQAFAQPDYVHVLRTTSTIYDPIDNTTLEMLGQQITGSWRYQVRSISPYFAITTLNGQSTNNPLIQLYDNTTTSIDVPNQAHWSANLPKTTSGSREWVNTTCDYTINASKPAQRSWYVVINGTKWAQGVPGLDSLQWSYIANQGGGGRNYNWPPSPAWNGEIQSRRFCLVYQRLYRNDANNQSRVFQPSQVSLKVNGTSFDGNGRASITGSSIKTLNFSSTITCVSSNVTLKLYYTATDMAPQTFTSDGSGIVNWNITSSALETYPSGTQNRELLINIPAGWTVKGVYNASSSGGLSTAVNYTRYTVISNLLRITGIIPDSFWQVRCTSINQITSISIKVNGNVVTSANVTNTVIFSAMLASAQSTGNMTVGAYYPVSINNSLVYSTFNASFSIPVSTVYLNPGWTISKDVLGIYRIQARWNSSIAVGFLSVTLTVLGSMNAGLTSITQYGSMLSQAANTISENFNEYQSSNPPIKHNGIEDFESYSIGMPIQNTAYWNNWVSNGYYTFTAQTQDGSQRGCFSKTVGSAAASYPTYIFGTAQSSNVGQVGYTINSGTMTSGSGTTCEYALIASDSTPIVYLNFFNSNIRITTSSSWVDLVAFSASTDYVFIFSFVDATHFYLTINGTVYNNGGSKYLKYSGTNKLVGGFQMNTDAGATRIRYIDNIWTSWNSAGPSIRSTYTFIATQNHGSQRGCLSKIFANSIGSWPIYAFTSVQLVNVASAGYIINPSSISGGNYLVELNNGGTPVQQLQFVSNGSIQVMDNAIWRTLRPFSNGTDYNVTINFVSATKYNVLINGTMYNNGGGNYTKSGGVSLLITSLKIDATIPATGPFYIDNIWINGKFQGHYFSDITLIHAMPDANNGSAIPNLAYSYVTNGTTDASGTTSALTRTQVLPFTTRADATYSIVVTFQHKYYNNFTSTILVKINPCPTYSSFVNATQSGQIVYSASSIYYVNPSSIFLYYTTMRNSYTNALVTSGVTSSVTDGTHGPYPGTQDSDAAVKATVTTSQLATDTQLTVSATDSCTNYVSSGVSISLVVDPNAPTTTISFTSSYTSGSKKWATSSTSFSLSANDPGSNPSGVQKTYYKWSGSGAHAWTQYSAPFSMTGMSNGTYTISWCSWDNSGNNETLKTQVVYIDTIAPTTAIGFTASYTSGPKSWVTPATVFTLTPADNAGGSGIAATDWKFSGAGSHAWTAGVSFTLAGISNGTYTISWCSWDNLAVPNNETLRTQVVYIDTIAPTTSIGFTASYTSGPKSWVTPATVFTLTPADNAGGSGLAATYWKFGGSGSHGWTSGVSFTLAGMGNGTYTISWCSWDNLAVPNNETLKTQVVYIDTIAPTTAIGFTASYTSGPKSWVTPATTFTLTPADNAGDSGLAATYRKFSGSGSHAWTSGVSFNLAGMGNGTYTISWCSWDNLAVPNNETLKTQVVYIDTIAPTTSIGFTASYTSGPKSWVTPATTFTLTPADNAGGSGLAATYWKFSGSGSHAWTSGVSFTLAGMSNGTYTISWCSWDNLAIPNNGTLKTQVVYIDTIAPTTSIGFTASYTSGPKSWVTPATVFTLTPADNAGGSGVAATYWKFSGSGSHAWTSGVSFNLAGMGNGTYTISWCSWDNLAVPNNETLKTQVVYIDTIAPTTAIGFTASYTSGPKSWVTLATVCTLTPADNAGGSGVAATFWKFSGSGSHAWISGVSFTFVGMSNGTYTISWCSWDNLAVPNNETLKTQVVYIDTIAPTTSIGFTASYTSGSKSWVTPATTFTLTPADNAGGSGVAATYWKFSGSGSHAWTSGVSFNLAGMGNGTYTISWCSWDNLAVPNNETLKTQVVYIDTIAPTTSIGFTASYTSGPKSWVTPATTFTLTPADNAGGSGLAATYW